VKVVLCLVFFFFLHFLCPYHLSAFLPFLPLSVWFSLCLCCFVFTLFCLATMGVREKKGGRASRERERVGGVEDLMLSCLGLLVFLGILDLVWSLVSILVLA
jgi:hypothetical protein